MTRTVLIDQITFEVIPYNIWAVNDHKQTVTSKAYYVTHQMLHHNLAIVLCEDGFRPVNVRNMIIEAEKFDSPEAAEAAAKEAMAWDKLGA